MLKHKTIDLTKPVCTRSGLSARILCTDRKAGCYPVAALVTTPSGDHDSIYAYTAEGRYAIDRMDDLDLINKIETTYSYHNVGHHEYNTYSGSDTLAQEIAQSRYVAGLVMFVVRHTYEDGVLTAVDMAHSYVDHPETRA